MFTGLVQQVGRLQTLTRAADGWSLVIAHAPWPDALTLGESMAVQGACLTVTAILPHAFTADVLDETLQRTALRHMTSHARVNLERALAMGDRLGGHLVSGHIDECGILGQCIPHGRDVAWRIACTPQLARQTVQKGSVAIDGVSLTVTGVGDDWIEVHLIPHTLSVTTLGDRHIGDALNLEGDLIGKHVARWLGHAPPQRELTETLLAEHGFL